MPNVLFSVFESAGEHQWHDRGFSIFRNQRLVVFLVVVPARGHGVAAQGKDIAEHRLDLLPEGRVVHGQGFRLDDNDFSNRLRPPEPAFQHIGGSLRVGAGCQSQFRGRGAFKQAGTEPGCSDCHNQPDRDSDERSPDTYSSEKSSLRLNSLRAAMHGV